MGVLRRWNSTEGVWEEVGRNPPAVNVVDLTGATTDYLLAVGETAFIDYVNATSVPLHVGIADKSVYEINISCDIQNYATCDSHLDLIGASGAWELDIVYPSSATAMANYVGTGTGANFNIHIADGTIRNANITLSARNGNISYICHSNARATSAYIANRSISASWKSTITSLGTITHAVAHTGRITIKRRI
jgi:hypothetical protein